MRKIWYLKQEKGQKTKTAKVFLYEKDGHVEGRMDLSAFNDCEKGGKAPLLLHMKDASGRDIEKISLESENVLYEGFFQGKGKIKAELADRLKKLKGEAMLSVTLGKGRYLSEGWKDEDIVPEKAGGKKEETGSKRENIEETCDKEEETERAEEKRAEIKETGKDNSKTKAGKRKKKNKEAVKAQEELEALQKRLKLIFEEFDNIYVSFSGGKDSGLLLNLVLDFKRKYYPERKIGVFHQDFEAQYTVTTEYIEKTFEEIKVNVFASSSVLVAMGRQTQ